MRLQQFDLKRAVDIMDEYIKIYKLKRKELPIFYGTVEHVAQSGMSRDVEIFFIINNEKHTLGRGKVYGCGMDMLFHTASNIFEIWKKKNGIGYDELPYQKYFHERQF